jgi:hypothetical protein
VQRYEKVRAEANGKRSFRHRRPRNGPVPPSVSPPAAGPACLPARLVRRPSPPAVRPGIFPSAFPIPPGPSAARPGPIRSRLLPPVTPRLPPGPVPPGPVPSAAFPAALPGVSAAFPLLPPGACPSPTPVRFYLPPVRRSLRSSVLPSHSARRRSSPSPSSSRRHARGPAEYFADISLFCKNFILLRNEK